MAAVVAAGLSATMIGPPASAQADDPVMLHPRLAVETVASGLVTPISLAFLGEDDLLVLEGVDALPGLPRIKLFPRSAAVLGIRGRPMAEGST